MNLLTGDYTIWASTLLLVLFRLAGVLLVAPVFSHSAVPVKLRVLTAIVMSLAVVGRLGIAVSLPNNAAEFAIVGAGELLIGAVIGYAVRVVFAGIALGAFHISQQMGLGLGETLSQASSETGGVMRSAFAILSIAIFLLIGGHRSVIVALLKTFETIPPATPAMGATLLGLIVTLLGASFALALKLAAPVVTTMLLATVGMGFLQKTLPQFNLFSTHLPIRALVGLTILAASIVVLYPLLDASLTHLAEQLSTLAGAKI